MKEFIFRKLARCNLHHWKNLDTFTGFLKVFAVGSRKTEHLSLYVVLVLKKNGDLHNGESNGVLITLNGSGLPKNVPKMYDFFFFFFFFLRKQVRYDMYLR